MDLKKKMGGLLSVGFMFWGSAIIKAHTIDDIIIKDYGNLGKVNFPVSCGDNAQKMMNKGITLLHHMMYAQAEENFKQMSRNFPNCAMAYWGQAMTLFHPLWPDKTSNKSLIKGHSLVKKAFALNLATKREKNYLQALAAYYDNWQQVNESQRIKAWHVAQQTLYQKQPKDVDAAAFYALSLVATASKKDKTFSLHKKAGAILEPLYKQYPTHPGLVHYIIHAYDNALLAERAVMVARAYDQIAPDVPHSLHMPTHIFVRLGLWLDVINWNERSAKAALKYPINNTTSLHYAHAIDYMVYAYLQVGQVVDAKNVILELEKHHQHQSTFPVAFALSAAPARLVLERKLWQPAQDLKVRHPAYQPWDNLPEVEAITYFARGLGAARNKNLAAANKNLAELDKLHKKTMLTSPTYWAILVHAKRKAVAAWIYFAEGKMDLALVELKEAADLEDSLDKNPVTPGAVLPIRELLADMLIINQDYLAALSAYQQTLAISPMRLNSLTGAAMASEKMNDMKSATYYYSQILQLNKGKNILYLNLCWRKIF